MERALEELVWRRAGGRCEYCCVPQLRDRLPFEIDHIIAEHHGGSTTGGNTCLCCFACNRHKGPNIAGIDPKSRKIVPLFNPRRHKWSRHFRWDGPRLVGLTPAGRATIQVLKLNLDYRVEFRRELIDEGDFPPE
ncbi:HNH endonuclease [Aquisphaera insulae]|uniref:HNH endonuclease n=1 Tax=Aquisphaera insulae TaxID=2712864 RepID=UPI0013E9CF60|nr:HNH endonuclease signature motif containing protein [Aquisphaera insulae]